MRWSTWSLLWLLRVSGVLSVLGGVGLIVHTHVATPQLSRFLTDVDELVERLERDLRAATPAARRAAEATGALAGLVRGAEPVGKSATRAADDAGQLVARAADVAAALQSEAAAAENLTDPFLDEGPPPADAGRQLAELADAAERLKGSVGELSAAAGPFNDRLPARAAAIGAVEASLRSAEGDLRQTADALAEVRQSFGELDASFHLITLRDSFGLLCAFFGLALLALAAALARLESVAQGLGIPASEAAASRMRERLTSPSPTNTAAAST